MTASTEQVTRPARVELGRHLAELGALTLDWVPAFHAVDRSRFLPDVFWAHDMATGRSTAINRRTDEDGWLCAADSDIPIVTQWDDGEHEGSEPGRSATSSASMPSVVFRMLRDLDVADGMRVLEIGTGTGYNAALLAHRLGDQAVTTIEIDQRIARRARAALDAAGLRPRVICGDGAKGHAAGAPFDRIVATCGLRQIPPAWLPQVRPGGIILTPWGTDYSARDALAQLVVREDGTATGRFTGWVEFMKLRAQRLAWPAFNEYLPDGFPGDATETATDLPAAAVVPRDPFSTTGFILGLAVPGCTHTVQRDGDQVTAWIISLTDLSWAAVHWTGDKGTVHQSGPRRLWDAVEAAWRWWDEQGQPGVERFGLTVHADGRQETWLDEPDRPIPATA